MPLVGSWGDSSVLRCTAPLPKECTSRSAKAGDARWRFGGITVNPPTENFLAGFFSLSKLQGAKTAAILYENFSFSANTASGARLFAADNKIEIVFDGAIDRHFVNPLVRPPEQFTAEDRKQAAQLTTAVARLKALDPDIVALGSYIDLCRNIMNEFKAQEYVPKAVAVTQCMGSALLEQLVRSGDNGAYLMGSSGWDPRLRVRPSSFHLLLNLSFREPRTRTPRTLVSTTPLPPPTRCLLPASLRTPTRRTGSLRRAT